MILARVVLLLVAQMLSLHLGSAQPNSKQNISETCLKLIENEIHMHQICRTEVSIKMFIVTRSPLFKPKQMMSLYLSEDRTASLIVIKMSKLHLSKKMQVLDTFLCTCIRNGISEVVTLNDSKLYYFPYHIYVTNLVADSCMEIDSGFRKYLSFVYNTEYNIIHVGQVENSGSIFHLSWRTLVSLELMLFLHNNPLFIHIAFTIYVCI